jgi:hypothetical protein
LRLPQRVATQNASNARRLKNHAGPAALVVDDEHLRGTRIDFAHFADNAIRGDHCHIAFEFRVRTLIDIEEPRLVAAAGADDLRGLCLVDVFLLKIHQCLQALSLACVFKKRGLLQTEPVEVLLQILVFVADVAQIEVILPEPGGAHSC